MEKTSANRAMLKTFRMKYDALLLYMQTPRVRKGMKAAFNASPAKLGRAAVRANRKTR